MSEEREISARALKPWQTTAIDVTDCQRTEITIPLYEHERAGHRLESWPPKVRELAEREVAACEANRNKLELVAFTCACVKTKDAFACVLILHHRAPAEGASTNSPSPDLSRMKTTEGAHGASSARASGHPGIPSHDAETSRVPSKPSGDGSGDAGHAFRGQSQQAAPSSYAASGASPAPACMTCAE